MARVGNCCISFVFFPSGRFRCLRYSPISCHLSLNTSANLKPTSGSDDHSLLYLSGTCSTRILRKASSIVSSRSSFSPGSGSPSPRGRHERASGAPLSLPEQCFRSQSHSHIHLIQRVTSAPGKALAGKLI
jgi:hypothetical protein